MGGKMGRELELPSDCSAVLISVAKGGRKGRLNWKSLSCPSSKRVTTKPARSPQAKVTISGVPHLSAIGLP